MKKVLRFRVAASAVFLLCVAMTIAAPAQTFTLLVSFDGPDGASPYAGTLVQGLDGNFYGTTVGGGTKGVGTVFKITSEGTLTTLYDFCTQTNCADGGFPVGGLALAANGNLYGTTGIGGTSSNCSGGCGTVFEITPAGVLTTLHSFDNTDGAGAGSAPIQASDGSFYGTTYNGGTNGLGTVFKMTPAGVLTTLYSFCAQSNCADGAEPGGVLIQARDGNFYGTTTLGGNTTCDLGCGTVFKVTPTAVLTTLHSFDKSDGFEPYPGLVQAADGNFYGTTGRGGEKNDGTVFMITSEGTLTTLHSFDLADGEEPFGQLTQATDGDLYGTTFVGGSSNGGTIFKIRPTGALTTLFDFGIDNGSGSYSGPVQGTDGNFYGTTYDGGAFSSGVVYSLSVGLGPFVETLPTVGKAGTHVIILGNALTGTTAVTFNGTSATFTLASSTEIKTTVPTGATSGKVQVTTPHGTLTSNVVFRVK